MRRGRGSAPAVDVSGVLSLCGTILRYMSVAALLPAAVAVGYSEPVWPFLLRRPDRGRGWLELERVSRGEERIGVREGFLVVALTWLLAAGFGALPYVFAQEGALGQPLNAYFEAMSGFTTTGASVVADPQELAAHY